MTRLRKIHSGGDRATCAPIREDAGFSLIECLAALALVSMALIPFFSIQQTIMASNARSQQNAVLIEGTKDLQTFLEGLNPSVNPEGRVSLGGSSIVDWTSQVLSSHQRPVNLRSQPLIVELHEVEVTMRDRSDKVIMSKRLLILGWRE